MRRHQGFTLIEVMITVAVVAILAAIALPSYSQYILRARIADAAQGLSDMRLKMEQYFQDRRTYEGACETGTVAPPPVSPYFTYSCPVRSSTAYTVEAAGKAGTSLAAFKFTIDQNNARRTTAVPAGWTTSDSCWVLRKDGSC